MVTSKRGALNACYVIFLDLTEWKNLNHYFGREQLVRIQVTYVLYLLQRQENLSSYMKDKGQWFWQRLLTTMFFFFHVSLHGLLLDSYRIIMRKMQYFCCQRIDNTDSICNLYRQLYGEMLQCNSWVLVMIPHPQEN